MYCTVQERKTRSDLQGREEAQQNQGLDNRLAVQNRRGISSIAAGPPFPRLSPRILSPHTAFLRRSTAGSRDLPVVLSSRTTGMSGYRHNQSADGLTEPRTLVRYIPQYGNQEGMQEQNHRCMRAYTPHSPSIDCSCQLDPNSLPAKSPPDLPLGWLVLGSLTARG